MGEPKEALQGLTLAVIGAGKMGTAVLYGMLANRNPATEAPPITRFLACVQSASSAARLHETFHAHRDHVTVLQNDNLRAFQEADVILLACKPHMAHSVLTSAGVYGATRGKFLISVLAGASPAQLDRLVNRNWLEGEVVAVVPEESEGRAGAGAQDRCYVTRATPNMAASRGSSMTIIEAAGPALPALPQRLSDVAAWMFGQVGAVRYVAADVFDCGSALTGAGIAFMTVAVDGLLDGAVAEGMRRAEASEMLAETLRGMADLLAGGEHPAVLREAISSPRGTTIRGLLALEAGNVRASFSRAIIDATERARQM